ncbi:MAG: hypothetical protein Ct9H300mP29_2610 [Candidatus Neomarinimicrobiota bacterium]|nr:MAG: hypothetical protein Ct9H300mP29_2610 [Candidatus Neomarinimicrobiota bacterium]
MESDLAELFRQGDFANIHVSHMKVVYGKGSDRAEEILYLLNKKKNESSFKVSADVYPYLASHTTIGILFPQYALAPNHYETVRQSRRNDLLDYVKAKVNQRNGPTATLFGSQPYIGKTLKQVAKEMGIPFEVVLVDHFGPPTGAMQLILQWIKISKIDFLLTLMSCFLQTDRQQCIIPEDMDLSLK